MPNSWFRFKQFIINQDQCAHKVGTDGVLLGTWVRHFNPKKILDVGSGSGLISLMLAQRFPKAHITGIEKDQASFLQSQQNIQESSFKDRVTISHNDFLSCDLKEHFDLIVSNPPFFKGAHTSGKEERDNARHELSLPHHILVEKAKSVLTKEGIFSVILPSEEAQEFVTICESQGLFENYRTEIKGQPDAPIKRWLMEFSFEPNTLKHTQLVLRDGEGNFSKAYKNLTQDFYLNF